MRVPEDDRMPEAVRSADIQQQCHDRHAVADQADKRRRAGDGLKALEPEQVNNRT